MVKLYGYIELKDHIGILMELCEGESLNNYFKKRNEKKNPLTENEIR